MKTFINLALDTRRAKADGTFPVVLRIVHHSQTSPITLGIYLLEKDWDEKKRCIKTSYKGTESVVRMNNYLSKKRSEAIDFITKLDEEKTLDSFTVLQLKQMFTRKETTPSFYTYAENLITKLRSHNKIGTARAHQFALSALKAFHGTADLSFAQITPKFLKAMEEAHIVKGNSYNGLSTYLRSVRSIYNKAIEDGIVKKELYPFDKYHIRTSKTRKRAIGYEAIKRIEEKCFEPKHPLYLTRNLFLASYYMRGISYVDLAHLKLKNVVDGRIHYERQKVQEKPYDIKITPQLQAILDIYLVGKTAGDYIFPIIRTEDIERQYQNVVDARKRFNKKLKKLATACGIDCKISSYVSRHSYATRAKNLGFPIASISDALGHENVRTTEIYLDSLPSEQLDDMHEKIIS